MFLFFRQVVLGTGLAKENLRETSNHKPDNPYQRRSTMALIRWQPQAAFSVNRDIDKLVNQVWGETPTFKEFGSTPRVDIAENEQAFILQAELPGMKREEISVSLEDGVLTLSGERKTENE